MVCVGWYHSHPTFQAVPSVIDIRNQLTQQQHHRTASGMEPYVGAIVTPWDRKEPGGWWGGGPLVDDELQDEMAYEYMMNYHIHLHYSMLDKEYGCLHPTHIPCPRLTA